MKTEIFTVEKQRVEQESEGRYQRLLSATSDYVYTVVVEGPGAPQTRHGVGCAAVTGYTSAEFSSDPNLWFRIIYEEDRQNVLDYIGAISKGLTPPTLEHRIVHRNGEIRWISNTCIPHRDPDGRLTAYDGIITNITSRKRAELLLLVQFQAAKILADAAGIEEAMTAVLRSIRALLPWDYGSYWSWDLEQQAPRKMVEYPSLQGKAAPGWAEKLVSVGVARGEIISCTDQKTELGTARPQERGFRAACVLPVRSASQISGAILLCSRESRPIDTQMVQGLNALAAQVGQFFETRQSQLKLEEERTLLRTLVDNLPDCIFVKDLEHRFVAVNPAMTKLLGGSAPEDIIGRTCDTFLPGNLAWQNRADEDHVISSGAPLCNREETVTDRSGNCLCFLTTKVPVKDGAGRVTGLVGIARDITQRRADEEALRQNQERLALVLCASNTGIWDLNLVTHQAYFSPFWKNMLGYGESEINNSFRAFEELIHPDDHDRVLATYNGYLEGQIPAYELEFRLRHKDGSYRWILSRGAVLRDTKGTPVRMAGSHLDITERRMAADRLAGAHALLARREARLKILVAKLKSAHRKLQATQRSLIQAARWETMGQLAAGVAHEVKNPLQTILFALDYFRARLDTNDAGMQETLQDMRSAVEKSNSTVQALLRISADTECKCIPGDLNQVITTAVSMVKYELGAANIRLRCELSPNLPPVAIDAARIEQVFTNLFINALQAMPQGGQLVVRTYPSVFGEDARLPVTAFGGFNKGQRLVVAEVRDNGRGLSEEALARAFIPFYTTKAPGVGTGLGLSIVKKSIDLHGGDVDLRNAPGGGAVATVMLKSLEGGC